MGVNECPGIDWHMFAEPFRATIINTNTKVDFFPELSQQQPDHWNIKKKGFNSYVKIDVKDPPPIVFNKNDGQYFSISNGYDITIEKNGNEIDNVELFVLPEARGEKIDYKNTFDHNDAPPIYDGLLRRRAVNYPEFSSEFINLSCEQGDVKERILNKTAFTTHNYSGDTRSGNPGVLMMTSPSNTQLSNCNGGIWNIHNRSRNVRNDVHFFPHHRENEEYYYSISIKIPEDYPTAYFNTFYNILFEFHQTTFPIEELDPHCRAVFHLVLVNNNTMRINYGLTGINDGYTADFTYVKGKWIDLVFRVKWKNMYLKKPDWNTDGSDGLLEAWHKRDNVLSYSKIAFTPMNSTTAKNYIASPDSKTLYGPNMDNYNPLYITFNQYRLPTISPPLCDDILIPCNIEVPYETRVMFDNFIISKNPPSALGSISGKDQFTESPNDDLVIYPNPVAGVFYITDKASFEKEKVKILSIHDISGNEIPFSVEDQRSRQKVILNNSNLSVKSNLFVKLLYGEKVFIKQLLWKE